MYGLGILKGFVITMRNMLRPVITLQYPEHRAELPPRARWTVTPVFDEVGNPRCTACNICVRECPDHILHVASSPKEGGGRHIDDYVYEVGACMMCGLCVEACPYDAICMSHEYELATTSESDLVRTLLHDVDAAPIKRAPKEPAAAPAPAPVAESPVSAPAPAPEAKEDPDA